MRRTALVLCLVLAATLALAGSVAGAPCPGSPTYDPAVTRPEAAIPGFPGREATTQEILGYLTLVDQQSDRVTNDTFGTSWNGTPLTYSLVAAEGTDVDAVAAQQQLLRDPRETSPAEAAAIAASNPAIVWYTANVHGDEPSGGDAALSILYELAARTDCEVAEDLLGNLVVGIIPTQNPDGRDANTRRNSYGFDLNRDWFAWTQAETAGKLEALAKYPPVMLIDAHEMSGKSFFFPPNADPWYHEISPETVHWAHEHYGPRLAAEFKARHWNFFNSKIFDMFYMGYGDTVPSTAFTSAGMTFEKGGQDTDRSRWEQQFVAGWTSISEAAESREDILSEYYEANAQAYTDGVQGQLEPNEVYAPGNKVELDVPDLRVRHYFIGPDQGYTYVGRLVDRLLALGVEVHRLDADLSVPDLQAYGRDPAPGVVPAGSYWIPMAQPQKRWVQAMLGEDTYVPFPYFYDVTAWSNPLLMNLDASFSGADLSPAATPVTAAPGGSVLGTAPAGGYYWFRGDTGMAVAGGLFLARDTVEVRRLLVDTVGLPEGAFVVPAGPGVDAEVIAAAERYGLLVQAAPGPAPEGPPVRQPQIAVLQGGGESFGHLRYLLEQQWSVPFTAVTGAQVAAGALATDGYDVFVVPGVGTQTLQGQSARKAIRDWIAAGGIYIGTQRPGRTGGTALAVQSGFTTSQLKAGGGLQVPGTLFRVALDDTSAVTLGAEEFAYWYHLGEEVLTPSSTGANAGLFPGSEPDFWFSGYAEGQDVLKGSAALVDENLGAGQVILFSGEPNFRAYTEGSSFLLANALAYPEGASAAGANVMAESAADEVAAAMASVGRETGPGQPIRIEVAPRWAEDARSVLRRFSAKVVIETARGSVFLVIANPQGLEVDEHPFAAELLPALERARIPVRSAIL